MLGIGSTELVLLLLIILVFLGPKDLVKFSRILGEIFGKLNANYIKFRRELNMTLSQTEDSAKMEEEYDPVKTRLEQKLSRLKRKDE